MKELEPWRQPNPDRRQPGVVALIFGNRPERELAKRVRQVQDDVVVRACEMEGARRLAIRHDENLADFEEQLRLNPPASELIAELRVRGIRAYAAAAERAIRGVVADNGTFNLLGR